MGEWFSVFVLDMLRGWIGTSDSGGTLVQMTEEQIAALEEMRGRHSSEEQAFLRRIFHAS